MRLSLISVFWFVFAGYAVGKKFTPCEVAQALLTAGVSRLQIPRVVCAAQKATGLESNTVTEDDGIKYYGMFQFDDFTWCKPEGNGGLLIVNKCNNACSNLHDDNLADDAECMFWRGQWKNLPDWDRWAECSYAVGDDSILGEGCSITQINV